MKTLVEKLNETAKGRRLYQQERAIQEVTDLICRTMKHKGVTRAELARRIGITRSGVTHMLDGRTNLTVRKLADIFVALGRSVHFQDGHL